jgi:DNA (cytosine-5)-methyltransferase 1
MVDNSYQFNLFNFDKEHFKIDKPIRLIELFSGIGAQAKALEILGVPFEHWKTCEWAYPSIKAYNSIHLKDFADYSANLNKQELIAYLQGNISTDYNTPCDVSKKNEQWLRETYNHCIATHNMMNIMKIGGKDLEIVDVDKYCYIITYSFPCQDLSLAGTRKGMATSQADGGTRSGLLWEVERILDELENKPQILLMENVPEVIGTKNVEHFNKWLAKLESLGYSNFFQILNAKDYGIPQNRRRCFMVSILGEWAYDFPLKIKLEYRLKDFLEKEVDEKYYLTKKKIKEISNWEAQQKPLDNMKKNIDISPTLTARGAGEEHSGMVLIDENLFEDNEVVDLPKTKQK